MRTILFLLFFLSFNTYSLVSSGDQIKAIEYNNSKFTIGDIKHSVLSLVNFQSLHGSCWIQLNQGSDNSDINISGSDLALLNGNTIKSSSGRVLRASGGNSASLGSTQEDSLQGHRHSFSLNGGWGPGSSDGGKFRADLNSPKNAWSGTVGTPLSDGVNGTPRTSNETRMKNLTVNMFLKINHNCN